MCHFWNNDDGKSMMIIWMQWRCDAIQRNDKLKSVETFEIVIEKVSLTQSVR